MDETDRCMRVMAEFRGLFIHHVDPSDLADYVTRNDGLLLRIDAPPGIGLRLGMGAVLKEERVIGDPSRFLCCGEHLMPLGVFVMRTFSKSFSCPGSDEESLPSSEDDDAAEEKETGRIPLHDSTVPCDGAVGGCDGVDEFLRPDDPERFGETREPELWADGEACDGLQCYEERIALAYMGEQFRLYAFGLAMDDRALFLIAHDLEELARYGLSRCELAYGQGRWNRGGNVDARLAEQRRGRGRRDRKKVMHFIVVSDRSRRGSSGTARRLNETDVLLPTPGESAGILRTVHEVDQLTAMWPFRDLSAREFARWKRMIHDHLLTPWYPMGCVGDPVPGTHHFQAIMLIVVDWYGAVYGVPTLDDENEILRLADDLPTFFAMGLLKYAFNGRRFDSSYRRRGRLEHPPRCPHRDLKNVRFMRDTMLSMRQVDLEVTKRDIVDRYMWMCRRERYDDQTDAWEQLDPNALVIHRADTILSKHVAYEQAQRLEQLSEWTEPERAGAGDNGPKMLCLSVCYPESGAGSQPDLWHVPQAEVFRRRARNIPDNDVTVSGMRRPPPRV